MSSLSLPLPLSPRMAPRAAAFGQIVRNEARLVRASVSPPPRWAASPGSTRTCRSSWCSG